MAKLTAKQEKLFNDIGSGLRKELALEYIKNGYENGTKCYLLACKNLNRKPSKNPETSASEILSYPNVRDFIDSMTIQAADNALVTAEYIIKSIKSVADRCMQAEQVMVQGQPTGEYKFDASGANKSLELLGRHLKMFTDKIDLTASLVIKRTRKRFDGSTPE